MNINDGRIQDIAMLEELYKTGKEKVEDWEELPADLTDAERASLQAPMNRHERRAAIKLARLSRNAKKRKGITTRREGGGDVTHFCSELLLEGPPHVRTLCGAPAEMVTDAQFRWDGVDCPECLKRGFVEANAFAERTFGGENMTNIPTDAEYLERLKKPITDEKLAELDSWYSKCSSNSLKFCDADYLAIRARLKMSEDELKAAREVVDAARNMYGMTAGENLTQSGIYYRAGLCDALGAYDTGQDKRRRWPA